MLTFSDPVANLKLSKKPTAQIRSLQSRKIHQRSGDKSKPTYSEWLADKIRNERELSEENQLKNQKDEEVQLKEKKDREIQSEMSYLRWLDDIETRENGKEK